jgi:hypothetical protein
MSKNKKKRVGEDNFPHEDRPELFAFARQHSLLKQGLLSGSITAQEDFCKPHSRSVTQQPYRNGSPWREGGTLTHCFCFLFFKTTAWLIFESDDLVFRALKREPSTVTH